MAGQMVPMRKGHIATLSTTCGQLWGADRVLRSIQFLGRIVAESPEVHSVATPEQHVGALWREGGSNNHAGGVRLVKCRLQGGHHLEFPL